MATPIEEVFSTQSEPMAEELLQGSLGYGLAVTRGGEAIRYVVVGPESEFLPEGELVGRYDQDTLIVSDDVPTRPLPHAAHLMTQSELIRQFVNSGLTTGQRETVPRPQLVLEEVPLDHAQGMARAEWQTPQAA